MDGLPTCARAAAAAAAAAPQQPPLIPNPPARTRLITHDLRIGVLNTATPLLLPLLRGEAALGTIQSHMLVLQGEHDLMLPPANAQGLYDKLTGAASRKCVLFPGMKHWLSQETPDNVAKVQAELLGWLEARLSELAAGGAGAGAAAVKAAAA
jgi:pimeloyl-ACP methyl ester carboxylesterase